jgi:hypothetical protein
MTTQMSEISPESEKSFALHGDWTVYYHLPQDRNWDLGSYKVIMSNINQADKLIALNEQMPAHIVQHCMLFVMRKGIAPMWEDVHNRDGGCFSFKVGNKQVVDVWKSLFYAMCGETLFTDKRYAPLVNGITISPKKNFCIVKIWMKNCTMQDSSLIVPIPNLMMQGCLFKKHEPEF